MGSIRPPRDSQPPVSARRGNVRGTVLLSRLSLVRAKGGSAAERAVLARLPDADRRLLSGIVLPIGWYAFELNERLDAAIAAQFGGDAVYRQLGARSADDALGTTHRSFVQERDPHGLLKHVAQLHGLYKDTGYMTYEWVDPGFAILRTWNCASYSVADCLTNLGWHERAIELCGGRGVETTETLCRARAARLCEYHCRWQRTSLIPGPPPSSRGAR